MNGTRAGKGLSGLGGARWVRVDSRGGLEVWVLGVRGVPVSQAEVVGDCDKGTGFGVESSWVGRVCVE